MEIKDDERKKIIKQLQELSKEVLDLKESHRQKRPIVIEFSGSPKAGKTSCINSLELFLKRNGFKVEIVQEKASICPVSDKKSPMFNLWTACMSIAGMVGALEKRNSECDVLILDRGIFDACCWFEWLYKKRMFDNAQKVLVENFLLMDALVKRIDIVFAFEASPEKSIQREYANLLTDKLGSIMNNSVLKEYLEAVKDTIENKKGNFHRIFEVDTTNKTQDDVGKEVTGLVLTTLKDALMERIGYIEPTESERALLKNKTVFSIREVSDIFRNIKFDLRSNVESDSTRLQPIPVAIITNDNKNVVLLIKKTAKAASGDSPEKDKSLLYVGGHTRIEDSTSINASDFISICKYTLHREIKEELGISLSIDGISPFIIYTPDNAHSSKHIAICFVLPVDTTSLKLTLDSEELILTKGKSKSGRFYTIDEIASSETDNMENWSKIILKECFNKDVASTQASIFDIIELD